MKINKIIKLILLIIIFGSIIYTIFDPFDITENKWEKSDRICKIRNQEYRGYDSGDALCLNNETHQIQRYSIKELK